MSDQCHVPATKTSATKVSCAGSETDDDPETKRRTSERTSTRLPATASGYDSRVSAMSEFSGLSPADPVDERRGGDVARPDEVLVDGGRRAVLENGAKRLQVSHLIERRLERLGARARDR